MRISGYNMAANFKCRILYDICKWHPTLIMYTTLYITRECYIMRWESQGTTWLQTLSVETGMTSINDTPSLSYTPISTRPENVIPWDENLKVQHGCKLVSKLNRIGIWLCQHISINDNLPLSCTQLFIQPENVMRWESQGTTWLQTFKCRNLYDIYQWHPTLIMYTTHHTTRECYIMRCEAQGYNMTDEATEKWDPITAHAATSYVTD